SGRLVLGCLQRFPVHFFQTFVFIRCRSHVCSAGAQRGKREGKSQGQVSQALRHSANHSTFFPISFKTSLMIPKSKTSSTATFFLVSTFQRVLSKTFSNVARETIKFRL